jgi:transcriptional regulator with XRE-family HTH domain
VPLPQPNDLLRAAIVKSGLTVTEVAKRAGYRRGYKEIYPYLTGERPLGPKVAARLARALNLPPDAFHPTPAATIALQDWFASPLGASTNNLEREALRQGLAYLAAPCEDSFRIFLYALRFIPKQRL